MADKIKCTVEVTEECHKRFDALDDKMDKMFKKLFVSNGERSLVELVRDNREGGKRTADKLDSLYKKVIALGVIVAAAGNGAGAIIKALIE